MGKNKLQRFAEMREFPHVVEPNIDDILNDQFALKGHWARDFFGNTNPVVLELGCGKGEYTVNLAKRFPGKNFIGIDIKGARMWKGAKFSYQENYKNVGFLRARIENITSFFAQNEVSEIWLTFPDPQLKKFRKRLTSAKFLNAYKKFLMHGGYVHLKTDSKTLYHFTRNVIQKNNLPLFSATPDLYRDYPEDKALTIQTFYEQQFLHLQLKITYLQFSLDTNEEIVNPPEDKAMAMNEKNWRDKFVPVMPVSGKIHSDFNQ